MDENLEPHIKLRHETLGLCEIFVCCDWEFSNGENHAEAKIIRENLTLGKPNIIMIIHI